MTIDSAESETASKRNRRTLSESDVRLNEVNCISNFSKNFSFPRKSTSESVYINDNDSHQIQKRSHSLPHRYKSGVLTLTPTASPSSRASSLRSTCYTPEEFRRGIQAMQSWFRSLDDNQRTLAFQSITVRSLIFVYIISGSILEF